VRAAAVHAADDEVEEMRRLTRQFARELGVVGLMNVQFAIRDGVVYVLEVNPRASRTVPFVSKATGVSFARLAASVMGGRRIAELDLPEEPPVAGIAVKEACCRSTSSTWTSSSAPRCARPAR
jgi:carbamoyl-phosphate synthase large subunit